MIHALHVPLTIEDNESVRVLEWHVPPGASVGAGALLVELETHKALIEIRAVHAAMVRRHAVAEGEWVPLGGLLALLSDAPDESLEGDAAEWAADFQIC